MSMLLSADALSTTITFTPLCRLADQRNREDGPHCCTKQPRHRPRLHLIGSSASSESKRFQQAGRQMFQALLAPEIASDTLVVVPLLMSDRGK